MPTLPTVLSWLPPLQPWLNLALLVVITWLINALGQRLLRQLERRAVLNGPQRGVLKRILRWSLLVVMLFTGLSLLGVSPAAVWAALSALLLVVGVAFFALWSVLSNAMCALILVLARPFQLGDEIELFEPKDERSLRGKVVGLNLIFVTLSEHGTGHWVRVPNNLFFQRTIRLLPGDDTEPLTLSASDQRD